MFRYQVSSVHLNVACYGCSGFLLAKCLTCRPRHTAAFTHQYRRGILRAPHRSPPPASGVQRSDLMGDGRGRRKSETINTEDNRTSEKMSAASNILTNQHPPHRCGCSLDECVCVWGGDFCFLMTSACKVKSILPSFHVRDGRWI